MNISTDLIWSRGEDRVRISPRLGGRIVSWTRDGEERVHPPVLFEGGLFRILFAEEQYPGTGYVTPHEVIDWRPTPEGFRARLRSYWNTPGWFMRRAGWPGKRSELHVDSLLLEKDLEYHLDRDIVVCDLAITNVGPAPRYLTPWVHLSFAPWPNARWVAVNGERQDYTVKPKHLYWGGHAVPPGAHAAVVLRHASRREFAVLGAASDCLLGLCSHLPVKGEFLQASAELCGNTVELAAGDRFRMNAYLAFTSDWERVTREPPIALRNAVEPAEEEAKAPDLVPLLAGWMLPEEARRGLMVLSFLDKPPFYTDARYAAAHVFAGFRERRGRACANVMLYAARDIPGLRVSVADGAPEWRVRLDEFKEDSADGTSSVAADLKAHDFVPLFLSAPLDLTGRERVRVSVTAPGHPPVLLTVDPDACLEPQYPYHVRQTPAYLEQRYAEKLGSPPEADAEEIRAWQERMRGRIRQWLDFNASGTPPLAPRLTERQEGPTCVREKWLVQTEPGFFVPGYLIRPRALHGRRPLVYVLHGSGPGKDGYASDERITPLQTQMGHELESLAYRLADRLNCLVYVPDGRGQGELGETDPGRCAARMAALGISNVGLRLRDQIRTLDWLVSRDEVDSARIGSCGASGGGHMTYLFAAADQRVLASVVSSSEAYKPLTPAPAGWFHRMLLPRDAAISPYGPEPLQGAPLGMLIAPRPLWIIDGRDDALIPPALRPEWRDEKQRGRNAIRNVYDRLQAGDRMRDTWFDGGHCAGMTAANMAEWFGKWFG